MNEIEPKRELQRVFDFIVKHNNGTISWPNGDIRKMIRWAWYFKRLFILYAPAANGGQRVAACGIAWRCLTPNIKYETVDLSVAGTEFGDYLSILQVIVHPEYRKKGLLFGLITLAMYRYPGVKEVFWRDKGGRMYKSNINELLTRLSKGVDKLCQVDQADPIFQI